MAKLLPYGGVTYPSQGSSDLQDFVKHFTSTVDFDDLQTQINVWLLFLSGDTVLNRAAIRTINFTVLDQSPPDSGLIYLSQVHYIFIGDADDDPNA